MIVISGENIRLLSIMILFMIWIYLVIEALAMKSVENDRKNNR